MLRDFFRGLAKRGLIPVSVFLVLAAFSVWVGTAPRYDEEEYPSYQQDPGELNIFNILEGGTVPQTFGIIGVANGQWFFDGSMPVEVVTPDGNVIWTGLAEATAGDYMKDIEIPFIANVDVGNYVGPVEISIRRAYQGDDPAYDKEFRMQIIIEVDTTSDQQDAPMEDLN
ncbi:MAG: hypothetical protein G01um10148_400 [Parcubacteria group bacterium Gr01-1014_8]|nr:MAG: hypothetical protein G01um10148_400 [Parcubacteria group bacterium Gr01-1014_8]